MSSSAKMLLFAAVLSGGICAASLFRKPPGTADSVPRTADVALAHRLEGPRVVSGPTLADVAPPGIEVGAFRQPAPRASLTAGDSANVPPELSASSPIGQFPLGAPPAWGFDPAGRDRPLVDEASGDAPRRLAGGGRLHRVEDGDTLAALAARYLGDAARADEIRDANREAMPPNGALPIGIDLVIPPATRVPRSVPVEAASIRETDALGHDRPTAPTALGHGLPTTALGHGLPTVPSDSRDATPRRSWPLAEPTTWPADSSAASESNPVAPGVIRPASEPLP